MVQVYFNAFPDLQFESQQILTSGDHVIARTRLTGTHKGDFQGIAPTNRRIDIQSCVVSEIWNGKVIRNRVYSENAKLFQQFGVPSLPKTAAAG
jgi:predicted ester cyclase